MKMTPMEIEVAIGRARRLARSLGQDPDDVDYGALLADQNEELEEEDE